MEKKNTIRLPNMSALLIGTVNLQIILTSNELHSPPHRTSLVYSNIHNEQGTIEINHVINTTTLGDIVIPFLIVHDRMHTKPTRNRDSNRVLKEEEKLEAKY
jgi:hypothetical protein